MKKFKDLLLRRSFSAGGWKPALLAAGVLVSAGAWAQTVTVPAGCTVVVPGTGGGGATVGNGGIVLMPDPFAGGNFTFGGGTVISWSLLGDISEQTANVQAGPPPGAFPPDQIGGAVATLNIESYNKEVRSSELVGCSNATLARSKGRVTVNYSIPPCNNVMSFDILKTWSSCAPAIVGPNCWGTGLITFSVDQVISDNGLDAIGFDNYYWKITNGASVQLPNGAYYTSADRSSITIDQSTGSFTGWLTGGPYTIGVCYGRGIPWDGGTNLIRAIAGTTCVTKTMNPAPVNPNFTFTGSPCVPTNVFSINGTYTTLPGYTYSWTSTNGSWTLTPGVGTLTVSTMGANPGNLILTAVGPCGSNVYTYPVNRRFVGISLAASSTCIVPGTLTTISLPANAQGNPTTWTGPAGWTFSNGNAAASIRTYSPPVGTPAGCYTISASSTACPGNISIVVAVKPATPVFVSPTLCITQGSTTPIAYTVNPVPGATSYTWTKPAGWGGTSTTNSITLTPNGTGVGSITVVANGCAAPPCPSTAASIVINFNPVAAVVTWPCVSVGVAGSTIFTVSNPQAGSTYTWSFPAGLGTFPAGAGTSKVVTTIGTPGNYACSVTNTNSCGTVVANFTVPVAYTITVTASNFPGPPAYTVLSATPGCTSYQLWNCTTNSAVGVAGPLNAFSLNNSGVPGSYTVLAICGGCTQKPPCVPTANSHMPLQGGGDGTQELKNHLKGDDGGLLISPNPNAGIFTLNVSRSFVAGTAMLYDAKGQAVGGAVRLRTGANTLGSDDLAPGVYTVQIELDGAVENRLMVVGQR